jgi:3-methyladenine DNA glycosylase/8-oxoguanine DNA glycosylase
LSRLRYNRVAAVRHLRGECKALAAFIRQQGPLKLKVAKESDLFTALCRSIVYQQLSGKAAATIHGRFTSLFPDDQPAAPLVVPMSIDQLRSVGLSNNKALAVQDLARKTLDGTLVSMGKSSRMSDKAVIENLVQVRGIGPWTAQMVLMFTLGRPDVMPALDLGVQKGIQAVYDLDDLPSPEQVLERTEHLAPYRSAAAWYFWRAADTVLMS